MNAKQLDAILEVLDGAPGKSYLEVLRSGSLSMGVYRLPAGGTDQQTPHAKDEVYYGVAGHAPFRCGESEHPAIPSAIFLVNRLEEHRFVDLQEDLILLVFFPPAEGSLVG